MNQEQLNQSLLQAAEDNNQEKLLKLLKEGACVDVENKCDNTLLYDYVRKGDKQAVDLLLKYNADVSKKVSSGLDAGYTPIYWAVCNVLEAVKKKAALEDLLYIMNALIKAEADLDVAYEYDCTLLHLATESDAQNIVAILLSSGANQNLKDLSGETPRDIAMKKGYLGCVELFNSTRAVDDIVPEGNSNNTSNDTIELPVVVEGFIYINADDGSSDVTGKDAQEIFSN